MLCNFTLRSEISDPKHIWNDNSRLRVRLDFEKADTPAGDHQIPDEIRASAPTKTHLEKLLFDPKKEAYAFKNAKFV
jgi:hypothetical protein